VTVNIYDGLADAHLYLSPPDVTISVVERGLEVARAVGEGATRVWSLRTMRAEALAEKGDIAGKAAECKNVLADQLLSVRQVADRSACARRRCTRFASGTS
jgi:hypothetical protein